jgi:hypothetical protein
MSVKGRTARDFQSAEDVWDIADKWAAMTGYEITGQDQSSRLYQRGKGFWVAPQMIQLTWTGQGYHLEAWVRIPTFNRVMTLGLMPPELVIDSGGFTGVIPRTRAREDVNKLLVALGGQTIS